MEIVAEETGGRVFANTNALSQSIIRATDDARAMYVLGYYPTSGVEVRYTIALNPRTLEIRIVARDVATGKIGSLVIPNKR